MSELPDETADPARMCDEARGLAEGGAAGQAALLFEKVLAMGETPVRARAALGLAVVLDDAGEVERAREADGVAIATGDPEYGPRAAYHLALTHERAGEPERAAPAWRAVVGFGNPAYLPPAHLALARIADDGGDFDAAREHWEAAVATGDAEYGPLAAHDLAQRLLERGDPARAQKTLAAGLRLIDRDAAPYAYARLAVALGISYLDQAIGAFGAALAAEPADPETGPLATELLARTLPLRGRGGEAGEVWRRGLAEPGTAPQVRARLRRDFGEDDGDADLWWEPVVEQAVSEGTLPALAGEAFGALDHMYALLAVRYAERRGDEAHAVLGGAVRVPDGYPWGPLLHESFAERLRLATGAPVPEWPDG
ncbi:MULTISPECIES: tetratricopeptide repeat protein [Actinomadura]|jgi:tetratricopeptide (TPR) repeat protein|uniref:Tetratricopeptide repeat protein n=1 Tax=Actinomadura geliboluensis TaxID=882440 RepID=A0A5S4GC03_9ACTN|nr:tetratricopeptide repeat protein [Actinomadura geliboluensis]TMR30292.1 tetratricopeptide repeat protein [Actinomadura geliboluensis]